MNAVQSMAVNTQNIMAAHAEIAALREQVAQLKTQLDWFKRQLFGRRSEKRHFELLRLDRPQPQCPHAPRNAVLAAANTLIVQLVGNPRRSIALLVEDKNLADTAIQIPVRLRPPTRPAR